MFGSGAAGVIRRDRGSLPAKARFPKLTECSFDKGFHSSANPAELKEQLALVVLPRKGELSQQAMAIEQTKGFVNARSAHSAVESAINALEEHGLDRYPDHGIDGFKRYVALAVVARNIHRIVTIASQRELSRRAPVSHYQRYPERIRTHKTYYRSRSNARCIPPETCLSRPKFPLLP